MPNDSSSLDAANKCADLALTILHAEVSGAAAPAQLRERFCEARQALLECCLETQASNHHVDVQTVRKTPRLVVEAAWDAGAMFEKALHCKMHHESGSRLPTTAAKPQFTH